MLLAHFKNNIGWPETAPIRRWFEHDGKTFVELDSPGHNEQNLKIVVRIPLMAFNYFAQGCLQHGKPIIDLRPEAVAQLQASFHDRKNTGNSNPFARYTDPEYVLL